MEAKFLGEDELDIGVEVTDNNGADHHIEMHKDNGEIYAHKCDKYEEKTEDRSRVGHEHNLQARRYAKWYVYRERGYNTVPAGENPDRIFAALAALVRLSTSEFIDHFVDLETQIRTHYNDATVRLPFDDFDPSKIIVYQQDIYVEPDPTEFDPPVLDQFLARVPDESGAAADAAADGLDLDDMDSLHFDVEAVSDMHYLYNDGHGMELTDEADPPLDREYDARIELMPIDIDQLGSFQHYLVSHLAYQIRDCYLRMGLEPPMAFRATGWGKYRAFMEQKFCSLYENYWDADTTATSWKPA